MATKEPPMEAKASWSAFVKDVQDYAKKNYEYLSMYSIKAIETNKREDVDRAKQYLDKYDAHQEMCTEVINIARKYYWLAHPEGSDDPKTK